jgi:hypothetical protein
LTLSVFSLYSGGVFLFCEGGLLEIYSWLSLISDFSHISQIATNILQTFHLAGFLLNRVIFLRVSSGFPCTCGIQLSLLSPPWWWHGRKLIYFRG